jgi:hypothetical protein
MDRHNITEILLKVALSTITLTPNPYQIIGYLNSGELSLQLHHISSVAGQYKTSLA